MWLPACPGGTAAGNVDTAPHPLVGGSSLGLITFLSSGALDLYVSLVVNDLLQR